MQTTMYVKWAKDEHFPSQDHRLKYARSSLCWKSKNSWRFELLTDRFLCFMGCAGGAGCLLGILKPWTKEEFMEEGDGNRTAAHHSPEEFCHQSDWGKLLQNDRNARLLASIRWNCYSHSGIPKQRKYRIDGNQWLRKIFQSERLSPIFSREPD